MDQTPTPKRRKANTGVDQALKAFLADTYVLMAKTQACHWNATGATFFGLHKLTEAQYNELFAAVDELAERLRAIGTEAPNGLAEMLALATVQEADSVDGTKDALAMLAADNTAISARAKEVAEAADEAGDLATHDMLVGRIAAHDKAAWLLRSHRA